MGCYGISEKIPIRDGSLGGGGEKLIIQAGAVLRKDISDRMTAYFPDRHGEFYVGLAMCGDFVRTPIFGRLGFKPC